MATVKKGITVSAPEWWKHLKWAKRVFWKKQRRADKKAIRDDAARSASHRGPNVSNPTQQSTLTCPLKYVQQNTCSPLGRSVHFFSLLRAPAKVLSSVQISGDDE